MGWNHSSALARGSNHNLGDCGNLPGGSKTTFRAVCDKVNPCQ
jgi:hypothetical protein